MSTPSFIATLTNKVTSGDAVQLGMTRQNTTNPVESTSSFDIYGRPSALSTNFRETQGMDPMYRMCRENAVSRPQYSYYLNPSLGLNTDENQGQGQFYETISAADTLTGTNLGRQTQSGNVSSALSQNVENADQPFDRMLIETRRRFAAAPIKA